MKNISRKALRKQEAFIESQISVNMPEVNYGRKSNDVYWSILDNYYQSGHALVVHHM